METKEKKKDTQQEKIKRIASELYNMEIGETISPTPFFKRINIHPNTGRDYLDVYEAFKEIGFKLIRDKKTGNVRQIIRTEENLDIKKEIRDLKKEILDIKTALDEIKICINKKKK